MTQLDRPTAVPVDAPLAEALGRALVRHPGPILRMRGGDPVVGVNLPGMAFAARWRRLDPVGCRAVAAMATRASALGGPQTGEIAFGEESSAEYFSVVALPLDGGDVMLLVRDVTLDVTLRNTLIESRERFRDMVAISSDVAWETDDSGRFTFISQSGLAGWQAGDLIGREARDLICEPGPTSEPFMVESPVAGMDVWVRDPEARIRCFEMAALPLQMLDGTRVGTRGIGRDVTAIRQRDAALAQAQARERLVRFVVDEIRGGADPDEVLTRSADTLRRALVASAASIWRLKDGVIGPLAASAGPVPDDVVLTELSAATGADRPAARLDRDDESWIAMVAVHGDQPMGLVAVGRIGRANAWEPETIELFAAIQPHLGIALRQAMERASLERESRTDPLTGLLNRRAFLSELATALERSRRQARGGCLLFVDLDNFKPLNDLLGHAAGDEALVKLARMMGQNTRRYDLVGRLGGDEFAIWLDDTDIAIGERRAHALIANVAEVRPVDGDPERPLGLSIGLALFDARRDDQPEQAATLVARADRAMYRSKAGGKDRITVAEPCPASAA